MTTPAVIDLNADDIPDIVFTSFHYLVSSALRAISGADGTELWSVIDPTFSWSGVTAGDIDLDGRPEIIVTHDLGVSHRLRALTGPSNGRVLQLDTA